jgi:hypothetical protein
MRLTTRVQPAASSLIRAARGERISGVSSGSSVVGMGGSGNAIVAFAVRTEAAARAPPGIGRDRELTSPEPISRRT